MNKSENPYVTHARANYFECFDKINGWLDPLDLKISVALCDYQRELNIFGNVAEIGVYHGKYLIGLSTALAENEYAIAIDLFDNQVSNLDFEAYIELGSVGIRDLTLDIFIDNFTEFFPFDRLKVINKNSLNLKVSDINTTEHKVRFFSVDGGHTADVFSSDLQVASKTLCDGGIISVDDIFNPQWAGIVTSCVRYFDSSNSNLVPFALLNNKMLCCNTSHEKLYKDLLSRVFHEHLIRKNVEFSRYLCDHYGAL